MDFSPWSIQSNQSEGRAKPGADKSKEYLSSTTATFLYIQNLTGQVEALQADNEFLYVWTVLCPLRKSLYSEIAQGGKKKTATEREMCHHTMSVCNACKLTVQSQITMWCHSKHYLCTGILRWHSKCKFCSSKRQKTFTWSCLQNWSPVQREEHMLRQVSFI